MSENNRPSESDQAYEKKIGRLIFSGISFIAVAFIVLVVALPSIYEKNNNTSEKDAVHRLEYMITNMDEEITALLSDKKSTKKIELPEADSDDIRAKEQQVRAESKVIPGPDDNPSLVYTIQAGSFKDLDSARKLYDSILHGLNKEDLAYLRIEKVGQYYAVRIGKFGDQRHAKIFHKKTRSHLSTASMMKAYIKEERIKKMHSS